jgi:hypothetical protein
MQVLKATLFIHSILFFLCSPAACWVGQISSRRAVSRSTPVQTSMPTANSGRLFYKNDGEEELTSTLELSLNLISRAPKPTDLPKHSPPRAVVARTKMMLDMEMVIGRMAMVSFFLFLAGEVLTGLSAPQLVNSMFLWQ